MAYTLTLKGEERDRQIASAFRSWLDRHSNRKRNLLSRIAEDMLNLVHKTSLVEDLRGSPPLAPDQLSRIRCPILALVGERSATGETGKNVLGLLSCCEVRVIPGCTHSILWEATEKVRQHVVEWLSSRSVACPDSSS